MSPKSKKPQRRLPPIPGNDVLRQRAALSIKEAMQLTGLSRNAINRHIEQKDYRSFMEGERVRIITDSIFEWQEEAARAMGRAS